MIDDATGDSTVACVVDTSLRSLDTFATETLFALGICPEDVWICHDVARIIAAADADVLAHGKVTLIKMRKTIKVTLWSHNFL